MKSPTFFIIHISLVLPPSFAIFLHLLVTNMCRLPARSLILQQELDRVDGIQGCDIYGFHNIGEIPTTAFEASLPLYTSRNPILHSAELLAPRIRRPVPLFAEPAALFDSRSRGSPSTAIVQWLVRLNRTSCDIPEGGEEMAGRPYGSPDTKHQLRIGSGSRNKTKNPKITARRVKSDGDLTNGKLRPESKAAWKLWRKMSPKTNKDNDASDDEDELCISHRDSLEIARETRESTQNMRNRVMALSAYHPESLMFNADNISEAEEEIRQLGWMSRLAMRGRKVMHLA